MKRAIFLLLCLSFALNWVSGQTTLLNYTWDVGGVLQPDVGPPFPGVFPFNYNVASASAVANAPGMVANGLNPGCSGFGCFGTPASINLSVPNTGAWFDQDELTFEIGFRRINNEVQCHFFTWGTFFQLGIRGSGKLFVKYTVDNAGAPLTIGPAEAWCSSQGPVGNCPQVNNSNWHTYRFQYTMSTGLAEIYVDGALEWSSAGMPGTLCGPCGSQPNTAGMPLWKPGAATPILIGEQCDAMKQNVPIFDNALITTPATLPIELSYFNGKLVGLHSFLDWETLSETNNDHFIIERSTDNTVSFREIGTVPGIGNSTQPFQYSFTDKNPQPGSNFIDCQRLILKAKYKGHKL